MNHTSNMHMAERKLREQRGWAWCPQGPLMDLANPLLKIQLSRTRIVKISQLTWLSPGVIIDGYGDFFFFPFFLGKPNNSQNKLSKRQGLIWRNEHPSHDCHFIVSDLKV